MSTYDKIAWLPVCGGVTGLGLVLSYLVMRRRGLSAGLRGAAWSLLPLAAYLTGAIEMFWKMGAAIGDFAKGFVFSDRVWSGIAVAGLSLVLFVVTGGVRRRRVRGAAGVRGDGSSGGAGGVGGVGPPGRKKQSEGGDEVAPGARTQAVTAADPLGSALATSGASRQPAVAQQAAAAKPSGRRSAGKSVAGGDDGDDDMKDIEDILRRRGIN
jgi:hypothetical protein